MTNVRKLMARLNPANCRFDVGSGGEGGLNAQDIAGALGMVPAGIGRDLLAWCWWPEGAKATTRELELAVLELLLHEHGRRADIELRARRRLTQAKAMAELQPAMTTSARREVNHCKLALEDARADLWPERHDVLARIARAALAEVRDPAKCGTCSGRGELMVGAVLRECTACAGTGIKAASNRSRAEAIGRDESTYRNAWAPVFEWLMERLREEEARAAGRMAAALEAA